MTTTKRQGPERFAYVIHTKPMSARSGHDTHVARVNRMIDREKNEDIAPDHFGEVRGTSAIEASRKMKQIVDRWILSAGGLA